MKYLLSAVVSVFIISQAFAEEPSGCIVQANKKQIIDVKCKCLETKTCATARKLKYSDKFFNTKDTSSKNVFSEKEKQAYKESYDLMNKIMELKSQGLANSEAIKTLYFRLDKVNADLAILLHQNHPVFMKSVKKRYEEKAKARSIRDAGLRKKFEEIASGKASVATAQEFLVKEEKVDVAVKEVKPAPKAAATEVVVQNPVADRPDGLSAEEKNIILNNVDKAKYDVTEDDSLFDIISKSYKSRAYKKLLAPEVKEDKPAN